MNTSTLSDEENDAVIHALRKDLFAVYTVRRSTLTAYEKFAGKPYDWSWADEYDMERIHVYDQ